MKKFQEKTETEPFCWTRAECRAFSERQSLKSDSEKRTHSEIFHPWNCVQLTRAPLRRDFQNTGAGTVTPRKPITRAWTGHSQKNEIREQSKLLSTVNSTAQHESPAARVAVISSQLLVSCGILLVGKRAEGTPASVNVNSGKLTNQRFARAPDRSRF